jgi:hypothetical protein
MQRHCMVTVDIDTSQMDSERPVDDVVRDEIKSNLESLTESTPAQLCNALQWERKSRKIRAFLPPGFASRTPRPCSRKHRHHARPAQDVNSFPKIPHQMVQKNGEC